jgi:hypothetical protein
MNRLDLQSLAESRLADAQALLAAARWAAAYYLLGYAVECALKAVIARQFHADEIPDKKLVNDFYTHDLDKLLVISGLKPALEARAAADPAFGTKWEIVRDWSEAARYDPLIDETQARTMYDSVTDPAAGVFPWLKTLY